jgi:transcriptional regulator with XRE-family HTH domain
LYVCGQVYHPIFGLSIFTARGCLFEKYYYHGIIIAHMSANKLPIADFLKDLMKRRKLLPSHLASALNVSHATVSRWLSGQDKPSIVSCQRLAEYSGIQINKILSAAGYLPDMKRTAPIEWPEFREYARIKYGNELDEDLITMIEDLIQRKREKGNASKRARTPEKS